nr:leucine-rich repeat and fibronectin type-III domain-containing protein 5-like [Dermatophagoides farinae]
MKFITGNVVKQHVWQIEFDAITIRNNYYLSHLQPSLFDSSATINSLTLDSNPNLFANDKSVVNVFTIIANLIHLEALAINNWACHSFASNALASLSKLVRLDLHNNQLKQIDPNTFSRLFSLQILDLSQNMINNLLPNSLNLSSSQPCYDSYRRQDIHYFIDLSHNNLSVESFAPDTFNLSCSAKLQLTNNSIELLDENVFRPLFRYYTIIQLYNNPIECLHCNQSWLMKGRHCLITTTTRPPDITWSLILHYAKQMDHLEVEPKSSSLFVVNKYLDSYPADFREHDSQLLRCQSDFTQSPIKRPTDQRYPCIGHYFRCSHNHNDCHCLLVESSM